MKRIDIVVPCYNEQEVLETFYNETSKVTSTFDHYSFRFLFVDDGSRDETIAIMKRLAREHDEVKYLSFPAISARRPRCTPGFPILQAIT